MNEKTTFAALSRYETRISREYDRAIRALHAARAAQPDDTQTPAFPNEPRQPGWEPDTEPRAPAIGSDPAVTLSHDRGLATDTEPRAPAIGSDPAATLFQYTSLNQPPFQVEKFLSGEITQAAKEPECC